MTRRKPSGDERRDIDYGERVARALAGMDLGQTAVVKDRAAVALEAMEGTDEVIRRAGRIAGPGTTVVKVSKPRQDMRFDVPVVGPGTLAAMREAGARVLALDAGRTLLIDRPQFLAQAEASSVAVWGLSPPSAGEPPRRQGERAMAESPGARGCDRCRSAGPSSRAGVGGHRRSDARRRAATSTPHVRRRWQRATAAVSSRTPRRCSRPSTPSRSRCRQSTTTPWPAWRSSAGGTSWSRSRSPRRSSRRTSSSRSPAARQAVLQTGHIERFNPATAVLLEAGQGRALRRGPPSRLLLRAQPGRRRRPRPHDPRPRHRADARRHGARPDRGGRNPGSHAAGRHRQRPPALRFRADREPDGEPGVAREDPQVPGLRAADLRLGRLHGAGGQGLPAGGRRGRPAPDRRRDARCPGPGAASQADRGLPWRRSSTARPPVVSGADGGVPWRSPTPSSTGWPSRRPQRRSRPASAGRGCRRGPNILWGSACRGSADVLL